jgi:uncharacterized protein YcbK (DUF882 family)
LKKLQLLELSLKDNGYKTRYVVISGKRSKRYNEFLSGAPRSYHLDGKAIDIWVLDIDGDWDFDNSDIRILEKLNAKIEAKHPELIGAFGTYRKAAGLDRNMVHLDTRGRKIRYDIQ